MRGEDMRGENCVRARNAAIRSDKGKTMGGGKRI